ncbi:MAG: efflux transporter periplasmic adaptor subunit, partial [Cyanobacteria bacterium P01_F01_bin.116]
MDSHPSPAAPSVMGTKQRLRHLWLGLLTAALLFAGILVWRLRQPAEPAVAAPPPTAVTVEELQSRLVQSRSEFVGALEAQERVTVRPEVEGRISQIFVENGDRITVGTPVLQLIPDRPEAVVSGAIADIEVARAARNTAQAQLLEAEADRDSAIADKNLQDTEFSRTESLVAAGALAQQNLDQIVRNREAAI